MWEVNYDMTGLSYYTVGMSSSGQYLISGFTDGTTDKVNVFSDYYSNGYSTKTLYVGGGPESVSVQGVALSSSGQYQTTISGYDGNQYADCTSHVYDSSDYGSTWRTTADWGRLLMAALSMSDSGQYQLFGTIDNRVPPIGSGTLIGYLQESTNYGSTWAQVGGSHNWQSTAMSSSGQYQLAVANSVSADTTASCHVSSDYGSTWTKALSETTATAKYSVPKMSGDGQYMAVIYSTDTTSYLKLSSDNGSTWVNKFTGFDVAMSDDGKYLLVCTQLDDYCKASSDYGVTWRNIDPRSAGAGFGTLGISSTGQYQIITTKLPPSYDDYCIWASCDYGVRWQQEYPLGILFYKILMSESGQIQVATVTEDLSGVSLGVKKPPPVRMVVNHIKNKT